MWYVHGRKRKYEDGESLKEGVDKYFASISYEKIVKDDTGAPIINAEGEPVKTIAFAVPPTNESLCVFLGISRQRWKEYRKEERYREVCLEADLIIRAWRTEEVSVRDRTQGLQFLLSNDSGMNDVRVEVTGASMAERKEILAKLAQMQEDLT